MTGDISTMSEKELKNKVNELRTQIGQHDRELKSIYRELKLHRTNMDELKAKRDELNSRVKELVKKAREAKSKRDAFNERISALKASRSEIEGQKNKCTTEISELKNKRDNLNKLSKGSVDTLSKAYVADLEVFSNADIPLKHEIDLFERLVTMKERLDAAFDANKVHQKLVEAYESSKDVFTTHTDAGNEIHELAEQSQKYHLEMIEIYKQVDEIRKDADLAHSQITAKFAVTAPIRERIDPLKAKISQLREELDVQLEKLDDINLEKNEKKQEEHLTVAKEKLDKNARLSLEDLRILMEKGDIKF
ncbi:coiled-coil protein [Methanolobus halotolerans]|uniref:Phosphoserine phosphatase n=1 Tax=Methanolobus halotolerans TaxID=2052935 RepID=A0A4E0Q937_9EURY|nr:phosphoserine phosphatase [Methanolobus halotolerans]TGC11410.1 phosphoserine phosphatase [Methanolobus halotolerans]